MPSVAADSEQKIVDRLADTMRSFRANGEGWTTSSLCKRSGIRAGDVLRLDKLAAIVVAHDVGAH
jgi:hypothetical protein